LDGCRDLVRSIALVIARVFALEVRRVIAADTRSR
jgi:hypothetical protein